MAIKKPLVITSGNVEQLQPGDRLDLERSVTKTANGVLVIATPVYFQGGNATPALADNAVTTRVRGLSFAAADTDPVEVQVDGIFEALATEWDAVTGQTGGLTEGETYYLDPTTAGRLTVTAPTAFGDYVAPVGTALSATELDIEIGAPIKL
jgi:hypothetical protein